MRLKWGAPALLALLVICSIAGTQIPKVAEVVIHGNKGVSTDSILPVLATKVGEDFSVTTMNADLARIRRMGFFYEESVSAAHEPAADGERVTFTVEEHPIVQKIVVTGNKILTEADILKVVTTKIGEVMNSTVVARDEDAIKSLYRTRGYVGDVGVTDPEQLITRDGVLTFPVIEVVVEAIEISGNKKTKTRVIRRELHTKPGDAYNSVKLQRDLERIYNLDLFEDVGPVEAVPGSEPGKVIIRLPVKEKKTGQVSLGVGYSSPQGVVGRIELGETNFRGRGEGINLLFELGGKASHTSYELGFFEPYIDRHHTSVSASVYNKVVYRFANSAITGPVVANGSDSNLFNEIRKGGQFTLTRPINEKNRAVLGFRTETVHLNLSAKEANNPNLPQFIQQEGRISTLSTRGIRDTRDIVSDPARGVNYTASLDLGNSNVKPDVKGTFTRGSLDLRQYFSKGVRIKPTQKKTVFATRVMLGVMNGKIPFSEQFFVGGAETLRGYLESRFWGKNMFLVNMEIRKPISNAFQGVVFVDVGDAWGTNYFLDTTADPSQKFGQHNSVKPRIGTGVGVRVTTPIGPLRLDWGFGSEGSRTHFSIGHVF